MEVVVGLVPPMSAPFPGLGAAVGQEMDGWMCSRCEQLSCQVINPLCSPLIKFLLEAQ